MINRVYMPDLVIYGQNAFQEVGQTAVQYGKSVLIISDSIMLQIGVVSQCEKLLLDQGCSVYIYAGIDREPTTEHVAEGLRKAKDQFADVIIGLGGGSALDTAKAVAVLLTNEGPLSDYMGNKRMFRESPVPLIAIPTTAGTGSEVTKVTVIIDTHTEIKMMISQPALMPKVAIVDPMLTLTCPKGVRAASGLDALCHAVEAYISQKSHPLTDAYAIQAIKLIIEYLPVVYAGDNLYASEQMALAAMLAGMAFSNASVTLIHGMSRPIGALFHVPHGISNAMLLPAVLEYTLDSAIERFANLERAVNPHAAGSERELAEAFVIRIRKICKQLNIPNLQQWGIERSAFAQHVNKMAADALESGSPDNHPIIPGAEDIIRLYHTCYEYNM